MDHPIGCAIVLIIIIGIAFIIIKVVSFIGFVVFSIPISILFGLYAVLEFISTNILIALDKIFHPGFHVSPVVAWAFWGLVIGAAIQGYREMNIYGRKERGVLIALAPVVLLAILKLISPPGLGSFDVYQVSSPVAVEPPPPPEPKDDHSDTKPVATSLSLGRSLSGRIDPGSDVDYFKVQVRKSGVLTVYTTGNLDTRGILEDSSGDTLGRDYDDGSGNNFKIEQSVNAGTYYIKVESYESFTGSYTMHASFREQSPKQPVEPPVAERPAPSPPPVPSDDHSDTRSVATSLPLGGSGSGRIDPGSDVDYFKIQVLTSGELTIYTTGNLDTEGVLQNSSGAILGSDYDAGSGNNFKIEQSLNSGTYYIKVESYESSTGSYTMHASFLDSDYEWYRKAAEQGDANAQHNLGVMYRNGKGVAQDDGEAVKWYRKAAEQGLARAQKNLGWMYERGEGVAQDDGEAVKWYRKAAEQGYADAQNNLGVMYYRGDGVAQDDGEAVKWYRKAAEQGLCQGAEQLGLDVSQW